MTAPCFADDGMSVSARKARAKQDAAAAAPVEALGATPAAFRDFMDKRRAAAAKPASKRAKPSAPAVSNKPTDERMAKVDKPRKTTSGTYRAPHLIERLRDRKMLDANPRINAGMFEAAEKLYAHFYEGGLKGIKAQDLSRAAGSGDGGACQFPATEHAMHHRQRFRQATEVMGWHVDAPHRGSGRIVVDVVCFERTVEDAARSHLPFRRTDTVKATGMEKLCEGLYVLAAHWKLI